MELARIILAALIFPGILTALGVGSIFALITRSHAGSPGGFAALGTREGFATLGGTLVAGLGLAMLPWPWHPYPLVAARAWLWAWAAFELAFLLPLLPALLAEAPPVVRAAIREAQIGVLARALLWAALSGALALHQRWVGGAALAAHVLALIAALAAFPAAIGWGPFGAEERLTPGGTAAGLSAAGRALDAWTREVRAGVLLLALLIATLPVSVLPPFLGLALVVVGLVIGGLLLRHFARRLPRLTLPAALRFCLVWPMPLLLVATLALALTARA